MAASSATVITGANTFVADVTATADADITLTIPHALGAVPSVVTLTNLLTVVAALSAWTVAVDATNIVLTATAAVGSGDALPQLRVMAALPHSLTL